LILFIFPVLFAVLALYLSSRRACKSPEPDPVGSGLPAKETPTEIPAIYQKVERPVNENPAPSIDEKVPSLELTGLKYRVAAAYKDGFHSIQKAGFKTPSHTTLREDLKMAGPLPPEVSQRFSELVSLTEAVLYSGQEPDEETAAKAEQLANDIRNNLFSPAN
jgi:hypothetical protein